MPVLVHVGPHKTGTSWLQQNLFSAARNIIYERSFERSHRAFLIPGYDDFSPASARELYRPLLDRARAEARPLVISDEALGGRAFGQRFLREIAAERIRRTFPQARILITTRAQEAVLLSMYSEYLRYGFSSSLPAFLAQDTGHPNLQPTLDLTYYEWNRVLDYYASVFSPEQVLAVPMEWGLLAPGNYLEALEAFLQVSFDVADDLRVTELSRPSLSSWALSGLRNANRFVPQDTRYLSKKGRFSPNSIAYQIDRITPKSARRRGKRSMFGAVRASLGDRYVVPNQLFQERVPFDLAALSYSVAPAS